LLRPNSSLRSGFGYATTGRKSEEVAEMTVPLRDYNERSVITPEIWFREFGMEKKLEELKNVSKFIMVFPYMRGFIQKADSFCVRKIEWFQNLRILDIEGENIGLYLSRIGAPAIAIDLEELIYIGGRFFVLVGGVGVLSEEIQRGDIIIPDGAIRDEGTSHHYFPPEKEVVPSEYLFEKLKSSSKDEGLKFFTGKVWTTDAPYRETPTRITEFSKEGAICVDMETSACFAVANYYNVELAAIFSGADYVSEEGWDFRKGDLEKSKDIQERLFRVVSKTLKEAKL